MRREAEGEVEFFDMTLWDSIECIKAFSGQDPNLTHVEPDARAALSSVDEFVKHYEFDYGSI